ncbi:putative ubiquinone biosynthesis monooxygenase [Puttea exsequens]|nr:putative ubiquinone biosynthesis monooxygenase [Puttea exsequens]
MTENQNLTRALVERIDELDAVSLFNKASVSEIHLGPSAPAAAPDPPTLNLSSYPHVMLASNQTIAARLLVGADGPNGPVRKFAGLQTRGWDYNRHGVVATLKLGGETYHNPENAIGVTAYQRFLPTGPIALLALPGQYASLVWTTTATRAAHLKSLSQEDFLAMVKAAFRLSTVDLDYMSNISSGQAAEYSWRESVNPSTTAESNREIPAPAISVQEGSIASFPLRLRQATSYTTHRIALIGDAAHTIHPLAGQGLNMGLADAQSLASAIETAVVHGADIGAQIECLDQYNADMWMKNNRMLGAVDKLHWLYSVGSGPLVGLRSLGLKAVDSFGPAKEFFMRQAGAV